MVSCIKAKVLKVFGKPEISNSGPSVFDEDIGSFNISMDNFVFLQVMKTLKNILDDREYFDFGGKTLFDF